VIKVVREITGLGLRDAKDVVDAANNLKPNRLVMRLPRERAQELARKLVEAGATAGIVPFMENANLLPHPAPLPPGGEVWLTTVSRDHPIPCIKVVREITGLGLKDAKDLVDRVRGGSSTLLARDVDLATATRIRQLFADIAEIEYRN
jgi:ribosomal protein L7/L12